MKNIFLTGLFLLCTIGVQAQWKGEHDITTATQTVQDINGEDVQIKKAPQFVGRVQGTVGTSYSSEDIKNMPTRSINKIAGLTLGVESQHGETPIFKGAEGGTAYYVDGIRVRSGSIRMSGYDF